MQETAALKTDILNERDSSTKWRGSVRATIRTSVSRIWDVVGDFCGIHKWASSIEICELVEGAANIPGCVRYCRGKPRQGASTALASANGGETTTFWVKEKLLDIDGENFSQTYAVVDGNLVLGGFFATIRVRSSGGNVGEVEWAFELDSVPGETEREFVKLISAVQAAKLDLLTEFLNNSEGAKTETIECIDGVVTE